MSQVGKEQEFMWGISMCFYSKNSGCASIFPLM